MPESLSVFTADVWSRTWSPWRAVRFAFEPTANRFVVGPMPGRISISRYPPESRRRPATSTGGLVGVFATAPTLSGPHTAPRPGPGDEPGLKAPPAGSLAMGVTPSR